MPRADRVGWFGADDEAFRSRVEEYFLRQLDPELLAGWEASGKVPLHDVLAGMASQGFLGRRFSPRVGGGGASVWQHVVLAECLGGLGSESVAMGVTVHNDMVSPMLAENGTHEVQEAYLLPALQGRVVLAHAIAERGAGADVAAVRTSAVREPGGYRLNGDKRWMVAGVHADAFAVLARLDGARPPFGYVLLMVPRTAPGVEVVGEQPMLGLTAAGVAQELRMKDVRVPDAHRIGGHGMGLVTQMRQFETERLVSACRAVATAERLLAQTREHMAERRTFGEPLARRQALGFRLAEFDARLIACRQLIYQGVSEWEMGSRPQRTSAAVKFSSSRLARAVAEFAVHVHGSAAQRVDHPVNRAWRDTRLLSISTGSDEMMLTALARHAGWSR